MRPLPQTATIGPEDRELLARTAREVFAEHPDVLAAWLYGSAARGARAGDLDVAVLLADDPADASLVDRLASELHARRLPSWPEIDLRPIAGTSARFRAAVLRDGVLLFERDPQARIEFEARAMAEWLDFKPVWEEMRARMRRRWAGG